MGFSTPDRVRRVPPPGPRARAQPGRRRTAPVQVLVHRVARGAGPPLRGPPGRPAEAVEALAHGRSRAPPLRRLLRGPRRHARRHRQRRGPWTVVNSNEKRRARLEAIRHVLHSFDYDHRDDAVARPPDPRLCAPPRRCSARLTAVPGPADRIVRPPAESPSTSAGLDGGPWRSVAGRWPAGGCSAPGAAQSHGELPDDEHRDPIAVLEEQALQRVADLLPLRYERMALGLRVLPGRSRHHGGRPGEDAHQRAPRPALRRRAPHELRPLRDP